MLFEELFTARIPTPIDTAAVGADSRVQGGKMKVLVVYYSMYGHTFQLAQAVGRGVSSVNGAELALRRVEEFEVVKKATANNEGVQKAFAAQKDIPICTVDDLRNCDALILGSPTRYGNMTAQVKQLIDSTAQIWLKGELEGKPAGVFTSTASTHGGQETTLVSMIIPLLHLGMIIVGLPYSLPEMIHTEGRGGTPYGASTIAGARGELQPAKEDLALAEALGRRVAETALKLQRK